jgi:hypothetical protein
MAIKDILSEFGIKSVGDATLQGNETAFSPVKSQSQIDKMSKIAQDDANMVDKKDDKTTKPSDSRGQGNSGTGVNSSTTRVRNDPKRSTLVLTDGAGTVTKSKDNLKDRKIALAAKKETSDIDDAYKRSSIANRAKKETSDIDDAYKRNSVAKNSIKKDIPLPVSAKNKNRKTDSDNKSKAKVVTPAMIKAKGFTTLRDYLNDEKGLKRRDGKSVVRTKDFQANDKKAQNNKKILETVKIAVNKSKTKDDTKDNKNGNPITKFIKKEIGKVKSDFGKAVDETKRNLSDKRYFINGVDSRKQTPKIDNYRKGGAVRKKSIMLKGRGGSFKGIR